MMGIEKPYISALLLAGGQGSRFGGCEAKQWYMLREKSVLVRSAQIYASLEEIDELILVVREEDIDRARAECAHLNKKISFVVGGECRAQSSLSGVRAVNEETELLVIADAARCLTHPEDIKRVIRAAIEHGAACACAKITDTIKQFTDECFERTIDRDHLCAAQTPQAMRLDDYKRALNACTSINEVTDDCMLLEGIGIRPKAVFCSYPNPKLTGKDDVALFQAILQKRGEYGMSRIRIGHGYDVHRLVEGRPLILGGVEIPHDKGLLGHSDADVLLHAVMDAVLGALSLGDIGKHFPDSAEEFRGISSLLLVRRVASMMREKGARIGNLDATLVLEKPKVASHINNMKENIAIAFDCPTDLVSVKATTEEGLGFSGRMEGVSATAVVSLVLDSDA